MKKKDILGLLVVLVGTVVMYYVFASFNERFGITSIGKSKYNEFHILTDPKTKQTYYSSSPNAKIGSLKLKNFTTKVNIEQSESYFRMSNKRMDSVFIPIHLVKDFKYVHAYFVTYLYFRTRLPYIDWVKVYKDKKYIGAHLRISFVDYLNREFWQLTDSGKIKIFSTYNLGSFYKKFKTKKLNEDITMPKAVKYLHTINPYSKTWMVTHAKLQAIMPIPLNFEEEKEYSLNHKLENSGEAVTYYEKTMIEMFPSYKAKIKELLHDHCEKLKIAECDDLLKRESVMDYLNLSFF